MIFSLAKFYYDMKKSNKTFDEIKSNLSWANQCHGKTAKPRYDSILCIDGYLVESRWCRLAVKKHEGIYSRKNNRKPELFRTV